MNEKERLEKLKELVLIKLEATPKNHKLSIGSEGSFNKTQLIEHVNKMDGTGRQILEMELQFMRAVSSGEVTKTLASV